LLCGVGCLEDFSEVEDAGERLGRRICGQMCALTEVEGNINGRAFTGDLSCLVGL
jgi:hypothetical protein